MKLPWFNKKVQEIPFEAELARETVKPEIDFNSPTWKFIKNHVAELLEAARESNDAPHLDERKTAILRGKIRAYKDLLELDNRAGNATGILNTIK